MSPKRWRRLIRTTILLLLLTALLVYGYVRWFPGTDHEGSTKDIGAGVTASGSHLPTGLKAVATTLSPSDIAPFRSVATPVVITPGGEIKGKDGKLAQIKLKFKLSEKVDPSQGVIYVVTSETGKAPWQSIKPTISADGMYAEVTTSHLSAWDVVTGKFNDFIMDTGRSLTGMNTSAEKPKCDNTPRRDDPSGYGARYPDDKDALYVCMNKENDKYVLYIVNRKSYPLDVLYTANLRPSYKGDTNAKWLNMIPSPGKNRFILFSHDKASFDLNLNPGDSGLIKTELSGYGQSLYQLDVGLTSLLQIINRFGAGIPTGHGQKYMDAMMKMLQYKDCADAVRFQKSIGEILTTCFPHLAQGDPFGRVGTDIIYNVLRTADSWKDLAANDFRSVIDGSIKHSDEFSILVGRIRFDSFAKFVGTWTTHGTTLTIRSGKNGSMVSNAGPCTPSDWSSNEMCDMHENLTFRMDGSRLVTKVTKVSFTAQGGGRYSSCDVEVCGNTSFDGDTFVLENVATNQLKISGSGHAGYFCNSRSNKQERIRCGA